MLDFVKKTFDKIEEFKIWNAKVELEKTKYQDLKSKNEQIEAGYAEKEKILSDKEADISKRERQIEDSIDRTRLKLEVSIEEINAQIANGKKEIESLNLSISEKENKIEDLERDVNKAQEEKNDIYKSIEEVRDVLNILYSEERMLQAKNKELETNYEKVAENLRNKQKEIKDISQRQNDLRLYESRIQRYYDEAGINIKL